MSKRQSAIAVEMTSSVDAARPNFTKLASRQEVEHSKHIVQTLKYTASLTVNVVQVAAHYRRLEIISWEIVGLEDQIIIFDDYLME